MTKAPVFALIFTLAALLGVAPAYAGSHCAVAAHMLGFIAQRYSEAVIIEAVSDEGGLVLVTVDPLSGGWSALVSRTASPMLCMNASGSDHRLGEFRPVAGVTPVFVGKAHNGFFVFAALADGSWRVDLIYHDGQPPQMGIVTGPRYEMIEYARPITDEAEPVSPLPPWSGQEV